jgi:hypothetical protein
MTFGPSAINEIEIEHQVKTALWAVRNANRNHSKHIVCLDCRENQCPEGDKLLTVYNRAASHYESLCRQYNFVPYLDS